MKEKICHITSAHGRYDTRIFMKQCKSLANHGYDATLIVNDDKGDELIDGVKIVSTGLRPKNRKERFIDSKKMLWEKAIETNASIYQLHDPDLFTVGVKLKRQGKKVIFDSHEDYPQQIKDKQWIPAIIRNTVAKQYELYEKRCLKKFDGLISVTPHIVERLKTVNGNTAMVTNYPIIDKTEEIIRKPERAICFAGGIHAQYHHHNILEAIKNTDDIKYILAGTVDREYFERLKGKEAWDKVEYLGKVPQWELNNIYSRAFAGVAIHYSTQAKKEGSLGWVKVFEFMAAKLPIICTDYRLMKEIIEGNNCGICVDPKNIEQIKEAIEYLLNNPEKAEEMGENGRRAVLEKFNWGEQEKVLLGMYEKI